MSSVVPPDIRTSLTREELYALVWNQPMTHLSKSFGISDQGLAKICKRIGVPRPKQGPLVQASSWQADRGHRSSSSASRCGQNHHHLCEFAARSDPT
jgi:hypothetical protein